MLAKLYVYNAQKILIGKVERKPDGYAFRYAKSYLDRSDALSLNPIHLPLIDKVFFSKFLDRDENFSGILSVFGDALPGGWGKAVLNAQARRKLTTLEFLLENQQDRVGYLVFSQFMKFPNIEHSKIREPFQWEEILMAKKQFERNNQMNPLFSELFKQGASQGGARPKLSVVKDDQLYLAKLPSIQDYENKAQIEHGTLALAKSIGIHVAESLIMPVGINQDIFLTKRFDYSGIGKLPFLSMKSILAVDHNNDASYGNFALEIKRLNGGKDSVEIYRRMVFNAMVSNHDDHYLNHGLIWKEGEWRLSPAYDVVAGEGFRRTLAINAGLKGTSPCRDNLLSEANKFSLSMSEAKDIIDEMALSIHNNWQNVFKENQVDDDVVQSIKWAILHDFS